MKHALAALLACALLGCSSSPEAPESAWNEYVWVFLVTPDEPAELSEDELAATMAGHFENMGRLTDERKLLLAGPLGEPRSDPLHRGIFIFDTPSVDEARAWTATDPAVAAGVLAMRLYPWRSPTPMTELLRLFEEERARLLAADPDGPTWEGGSYVLASARHGDAARAALDAAALRELVLFEGDFGGPLEGSSLFALDVPNLEGLADLGVAFDDEQVDWRLHPWYGSKCIEQLPGLTAAN